MNYIKSKKFFETYFTRKDWVNRHLPVIIAGKKKVKINGNRKVRSYKEAITDGGNYKKVFDVQWTIS